jgi:RNA polymerase sigma factor (sigma-70 family)
MSHLAFFRFGFFVEPDGRGAHRGVGWNSGDHLRQESDGIWEEWIVLRCRRHDTAAPTELVDRFQRPLIYYLRRLVGSESDAWDVSQEAWLSVFRSIHKLREPRTLAAFIYQVARNAAYAHLRRGQIPLLPDDVDADQFANGDDSLDDALFAREEAERLHAALERLPLSHRDVLTLHFLRDLSVGQIAEVVGIPAGTVKSRIFHAKRALRDMLLEGSRP